MATSFSIREATCGDADRLAELAGQLGYSSCPNELQSRLNRLTTIPNQAVFVAEHSGRVVGWLHVGIVALVETNGFAEIFGLVVDEEQRGSGVGGQLIAAAERWAAQHGQQIIRVRSNMIREEAHAFYHHIGYSTIKQQRVFEKQIKAS
jgi:GNAT superfamily N-acetyltransferase